MQAEHPAPITVHVEVTEDDIASGSIDCEWCPVALAAIRAVRAHPGLSFFNTVFVGDYTLDFIACNPRRMSVVDTPTIVADFIRSFDSESPVEPFSFDIEIPAPETAAHAG